MSSFPPPVPKPASAGTGKTAVAKITASFVNLRNGPGTNYRDIGDIRPNSTLVYYPATKTRDNWIWVEQGSASGWVAANFIQFQDVTTPTPPVNTTATPYDNKVGMWHWKGSSLAENTIEDVVRNLKRNAPHVTMLYVKTSDYAPSVGARWMGYWDTKRDLAIDGPQSIDKWVQVLERNGMEFHAWCVPRGLDVNAETDLIIQACLRPGVKSMILDVEPYEGFWSGGREGIRPYMTRIRRALPGSFHIGMTVDPRPHHYNSIFPQEWFPFVNSIHTQSYWATFRRTPENVLAETFQVWGGYGRPVFPILQGDAEVADMRQAHQLSTQKHAAKSVSWWRLGVIGPVEFQAVNQPIKPGTAPPPVNNQYTDERIVRPTDTDFVKGTYTGREEFQTFDGTWGWKVFYKATEPQTSKVWARWGTVLPVSGRYEVSVFVPARHASTTNARYKIQGVKGSNTEVIVNVDQSRYKNAWVTLGVFEFDKAAVNAGAIFLNDVTGEAGLEIAFDAVRWRRVVNINDGGGQVGGVYVADGYESPIGTDTERAGTQVWPGRWFDASPFGKLYFVGTPSEAYHTGADLNLPSDADAHDEVYATASGVIVFAARLPTWGNVIIIKHDPLKTPTGQVLYSRYGHVENMLVKVGDRVKRGQQIAGVGNAFGRWAYHLHFDLSPTTILETNPSHWPGKNQQDLLKNYIDPAAFIRGNRPTR
jgi:murein DD-endopeptidase MepM/ murein hydrolase activator NlpD